MKIIKIISIDWRFDLTKKTSTTRRDFKNTCKYLLKNKLYLMLKTFVWSNLTIMCLLKSISFKFLFYFNTRRGNIFATIVVATI